MRKLLISSLLATGLYACSSAPGPAATHQLAYAVHSIEQNKVVSVIADHDLPVPSGAQSIVQQAQFHVQDNVYNQSGSKLLIPRDAIISAVYTNDGVNCTLEWQAVYLSLKNFHNNYGALALNQEALPSHCEANHGVARGERATITFLGGLYQD